MPDPKPFPRVRGLPTLVAIVVVGMGIPAFFRYMIPVLEARRDRVLAAAPTEPEGRVARWLEFGQPQIHNALVMARFSAEHPWFVTHVLVPDEGPPEVWGIDFAGLEPRVIRQDGMTVRVELDAPVLLMRGELRGERMLGVHQLPVAARGEVDGSRFALDRLVPYVGRLAGGLERDIPGAAIEIQVGERRERARPQ